MSEQGVDFVDLSLLELRFVSLMGKASASRKIESAVLVCWESAKLLGECEGGRFVEVSRAYGRCLLVVM